MTTPVVREKGTTWKKPGFYRGLKEKLYIFWGRSPLYNHSVKLGVKKRNSVFVKDCFKHIQYHFLPNPYATRKQKRTLALVRRVLT